MSEFSYWKVLTRRKTLQMNKTQESKFSRVMNTFDLTALGIGATLGVGVYVLAGHVSRDQAGPSVVLSFAIAAITSLLAGCCYAEFGARVPKAGSAYIYSYVCIGEFVAFIVGWNLILEYIIGSASVAKGISLYLDSMINDTLKNTFMDIVPIQWGFLGLYFDLFAFTIAFSFGICLAFGIQTSKIINNFLTVLNIIVVLIVVIAGIFKADIKNWQIDPSTIANATNQNIGSGGFFPFGFEGTLKGAATCFFAFVGFDCIATTGEEVKNPQKAIPRSILFTLLTIFLAYFSVATVLTLMWPYYLQDVNAPLPFVFQEIGWPALKWIVTIGGMIGLIASLFGAMFPLPRIIYAMSQDGLVFKSLGKISTRFKTPVTGTICAALIAALMSGLFELTQLVNMLSIGTLLAYTVVAISITLLRFMNNLVDSDIQDESVIHENGQFNENQMKITPELILKQIINFKQLSTPNDLTTRIVGTVLLFYCIFCFAFSLMIMYVPNEILNLQPWALGILGTLSIILIILLIIISIQPREEIPKGFHIPFVPFIPGISIFINIYLMLQLDIYTWIRFGIWMILGLIMYMACLCLYKGRHENEKINAINISNFTREKSIISLPLDDSDGQNDQQNPNKILSKQPQENSTMKISTENGTLIIENGNIPMNSSTAVANIRSLDQIVPESELSNNHKEIKNSNGKTFFIESSTTEIQKDEKNQEDNCSEKIDRNEDDAKSAIAILDDVLKTSEESSIIAIHNLNDYINRKTSVDSAMIPSFIEASITAMVHKSYESLREEENENWTDDNCCFDDPLKEIQNQDFIISIRKLPEDIINLNCLNDRKNRIKLSESIENEESKIDEEKNSKHYTLIEIDTNSTELNENNSNNSEVNDSSEQISVKESTTEDSNVPEDTDSNHLDGGDDSTLDPIHSEKFKNKLSLLISRPPPVSSLSIKKSPIKEQNSDFHEIPVICDNKKSSFTPLISNKLKSSKSDSDIQHTIQIEPISKDDTKANDLHIPQAPKFDPLLYQTLGRRNKFVKNSDFKNTIDDDCIEAVSNTVAADISNNGDVVEIVKPSSNSFKNKLEAVLKRGPSYRITKGQAIPSPPPPSLQIFSKSTENETKSTEKHNNETESNHQNDLQQNVENKESQTQDSDRHRMNFSNVLKSLQDKNQFSIKWPQLFESSGSVSENNENNNRPATIQDALKRLRPVAQMTSSTN